MARHELSITQRHGETEAQRVAMTRGGGKQPPNQQTTKRKKLTRRREGAEGERTHKRAKRAQKWK